MNSRGQKLPTTVLVAYYATVAAFFVASFHPEYRIWGISWWAYFPLWVKLLLLAVGLAAPTVTDKLIDRVLRDRDDISPATYRWLAGGFVTLMLSSFYFLRARTHFLGDGYTLLSLMSNENHLIKPREFGGTIIQFGIYKLMGAGGEDMALRAYQIVSMIAGLVFLGAALYFASRYFSRRLDRFLFLLLVASGGHMLMFFGYVENYAFFLAFTLIYVGVVLLVAEHKIPRWWIIAAQAAPIFFHIFGVVFIPATFYLLAHDSPVERWVVGRSLLTLWLLVAGSVSAIVGGFLFFYFNILYLRIAVLPFVSDQFTVDGYTMFSLRHLLDYLNLILIIFPAAVVAVAILWSPVRTIWRWTPTNIALVFAFAGSFGAAFIFDPKLGMPRDWDLFAFAAISLAILTFALLQNALSAKTLLRAVLLILMTNVLVFGPRVAAIVSPRLLTTHIESDAQLDPAKSGPTFYVLTKWLRSHGEESRAARVDSVWRRFSPEDEVIASPTSKTATLDTTAMLAVLRQAISRNVSNWSAWTNLGVVKYWMGEYDSSVFCLERAVALNPYYAPIHLNLALGYWQVGQLPKAASCAAQSYDLDSTSIRPLLLLSTIYRQQDDLPRLASIVERLSARNDAPRQYLTQLTDFIRQRERAPNRLSVSAGTTLPTSAELAHLASELVPRTAAHTDNDSSIWDEAVRMAVAKNPSSWVAWGNLGVVYLRHDAFDSAQAVLEIAVSINPINSTNFSNLAFAQFYQNDFVSAEKNWFKARSLDSGSLFPLVGLAKLYQRTNQHEKYLEYFIRVVSRPDAPGEYLKTYGDYFLMQKRWRDADYAYQRAITNGYPKSRLDSVYIHYPQLSTSK